MYNQLEIVRDSRKEARDDIDETITQQRCKKKQQILIVVYYYHSVLVVQRHSHAARQRNRLARCSASNLVDGTQSREWG